MSAVTKKQGKKNFLSKEERKAIVDEYKQGSTFKCIALNNHIDVRHVRDIIKRDLFCNNDFTKDEQLNIIRLYIEGKKASEIAKIIPRTVAWQVRNFIKTLPNLPVLCSMFRFQTQPVEFETSTQPVEFEMSTQPVEFEMSTQPVEFETSTQPVEFEMSTQPVEFEMSTQPVKVEKPILIFEEVEEEFFFDLHEDGFQEEFYNQNTELF